MALNNLYCAAVPLRN